MQSLNLTEESNKEFERCRDNVKPVVRPIVRRKDNPTGPTEQADCYEGLFWKSYVTPERWLCHVLKNIKTTPKDELYTLLPGFWEDDE